LAGKPLFRWILDTLTSISEVRLIVINTDARRDLAGCGLESGDRVIIRDRKPELCGDFTSMNLVLADDIAATGADEYLMTHVTNPFLSQRTIESAMSAYAEARTNDDADSLFGVTRHQTRFYRADGRPINHDPRNLVRTQDLEPWFEENSTLYIFSSQSFAGTQARIGSRPLLFEIPRLESVDIDTEDDWRLAEALASGLDRTAAAGDCR